MAQSDLERAIKAFRRELLLREEAATRQVIDSYSPVRARLIERINVLFNPAGRQSEETFLFNLQRAQSLLTQVDAELSSLAKHLAPIITQAQADAVVLGGEHALGLAAISALQQPDVLAVLRSSWNVLNTGAMNDLVGRLSDGSPLKVYLDALGVDASGRISDALKTAISLGTSPRAVATQLATQVDMSEARLMTISRSAMFDSYRSATLQTYAENADISDGTWIWISAQDDSVCLACLSLDGQTFPISQTFQESHLNCRCVSILNLSGVPTLNRPTSSEWFDAQSEETQRRMVPASAYDEIASGQLQLSDFARLDRNDRWGDRYVQSSVADARAAATNRDESLAA